MVVTRGRDGTWPLEGGATGRIVRHSLIVLTLETYYRYANVFGSKG